MRCRRALSTAGKALCRLVWQSSLAVLPVGSMGGRANTSGHFASRVTIALVCAFILPVTVVAEGVSPGRTEILNDPGTTTTFVQQFFNNTGEEKRVTVSLNFPPELQGHITINLDPTVLILPPYSGGSYNVTVDLPPDFPRGDPPPGYIGGAIMHRFEPVCCPDSCPGGFCIAVQVEAQIRIIPTDYRVVFEPGPGGTISGRSIQGRNEGTVTDPVTAVPYCANEFEGWTGDFTGTQNPVQVPVFSDMTIAANFQELPPHLLTPAVHSTVIGQAFTQSMWGGGGTAPYVFSVTNGGLPPGLDLDENSGLMSGAPIALGVYSFGISALDAGGCTETHQYTQTVVPDGFALTVSDIAISEGDSGNSSAAFTLNMFNPAPDSALVQYYTVDMTAVAGKDYVSTAGILTAPPGTSVQTLVVPVIGEVTFENNETFELHVAINSSGADNSAVATIIADDPQPQITLNDVSVIEGNSGWSTNTLLHVSMSNPSDFPVNMQLSITDGSATQGQDYMLLRDSRTYSHGKSMNVRDVSDPHQGIRIQLAAAAQLLKVHLHPDNGYPTCSLRTWYDWVIATAPAIGTTCDFAAQNIMLDPGTPYLLTMDGSTASRPHWNGGGYPIQSGPVTWVCGVVSGTTACNYDYGFVVTGVTLGIGTWSSLQIAPGQSVSDIPVLVSGDTNYEDDETFQLNAALSPTSGPATVADGQALYTILDDDYDGHPKGLRAVGNNSVIDLYWQQDLSHTSTDKVYRASMPGGPYTQIASGITTGFHRDRGLSNDQNYYYVTTRVLAGGTETSASTEVLGRATFTGFPPPMILLPPLKATPDLGIAWIGGTAEVTPGVGPEPLTYEVYRGTIPGFVPDVVGFTNRVFAGSTEFFEDRGAAEDGNTYYYQVTGVDAIAKRSFVTCPDPEREKPTITTQPVSQTVAPGETAALGVVASGKSPLAYQWYEGYSGVTSAPLTGQVGSSLLTAPLFATTKFWVMVGNGCGRANSNTATVTVGTSPAIADQPDDQLVNSGQSASLSVVATGLEPLSYQWYSGFAGDTSSPLGTNSDVLQTPCLTEPSHYWVRISNFHGSVDSNTVMVDIRSSAFPVARNLFGSATYGDYLYILGGNDGSTFRNDVQFARIYPDGSTGTWLATSSFSVGVQRPAAVAYSGYLYLIGGESSGNQGESTVQYARILADGTIGSWTATSELPTTRYCHTANAYNGYLYVIGGEDSVTIFKAPINPDGSVGSWSVTTNLPAIRKNHASIAYDGYLYVLGGETYGGTCFNTVLSVPINPDGTLGSSWSTALFMTPRLFLGAAINNGYLYVVGGNNAGTLLDDIQYATVNGSSIGDWTLTQTLPAALCAHGTAIHNGRLYVFGGSSPSGLLNALRIAPINEDGSVGAWLSW